MKSSLRLLTVLVITAAVGLAGYLLAKPALQARRSAPPAGAEGDSPQAEARLRQILAPNLHIDSSGDRELLLAISRLETRSSVTARIRQQATIGGMPFHATGTYRQQGGGTRRNVRWLLKSQRNGVPVTLLQVSDGRHLWSDRNMASGQEIDRIDLWLLRRKVSAPLPETAPAAGQAVSSPIAPQTGGSFGGLPMLLESLRDNFEFTAPRHFYYKPLDVEVVGLIGRWRPETLAAILAPPAAEKGEAGTEPPGLTAAALRQQLIDYLKKRSLPDRVPHHVLILLGRDDQFPRVIEYRNCDDPLADPRLDEGDLFRLSPEPLAKLEFYQHEFDLPIDTRQFIYLPPPDLQWYDATKTYESRIHRTRQVQLALEREKRMANTASEPPR